jgi:hypothetical protein
MKFKSPTSLQSWLFMAGVVSLVVLGLLLGIASLLAAHEQSRASGGANLGAAATYLAFDIPVQILEFAGLSCLILASLVSIFRSILPSKPK